MAADSDRWFVLLRLARGSPASPSPVSFARARRFCTPANMEKEDHSRRPHQLRLAPPPKTHHPSPNRPPQNMARSRQMTAESIPSSRVAASRPASLAERADSNGRQQARPPAGGSRTVSERLRTGTPGGRLHAERAPQYDGVEVLRRSGAPARRGVKRGALPVATTREDGGSNTVRGGR